MLRWLRERNAAKEQFRKDIELSEMAPRLHGVNLLEWRYLGRTVVSYVDADNRTNAQASLFSFCGVDDTDDRHFIVIPHQKYENFQYHTYVLEHAALWKIGERRLWEIVGTEPSKWLRDYMFEHFKEVWSNETNWWAADGAAPVAKKQSKLRLVEPPADSTNNNVVKVDFSKDKK